MADYTLSLSDDLNAILQCEATCQGKAPVALFSEVVLPQAEQAIRSWEQRYQAKRLADLEAAIAAQPAVKQVVEAEIVRAAEQRVEEQTSSDQEPIQ